MYQTVKIYNDMGHLMTDPLHLPKEISEYIMQNIETFFHTNNGYTVRFYKLKKQTIRYNNIDYHLDYLLSYV